MYMRTEEMCHQELQLGKWALYLAWQNNIAGSGGIHVDELDPRCESRKIGPTVCYLLY